MGRKTKIDWCDATWNPVTGCLHGCEYCYAERMALRFAGDVDDSMEPIHVMEGPIFRGDGTINPYPYKFDPTFHKYRLRIPEGWKTPKTVFVCSMSDLFGWWIPEGWIDTVLTEELAADNHRFLHLTKNPERYLTLARDGILVGGDRFWYGTTITSPDDPYWWSDEYHHFASIEPIMEPFDFKDVNLKERNAPEWIIVGAETGNRKGKVIPERDWLNGILEAREKYGIPVFMKESLREIMGDDFIQEFPWEEKTT